MEPPASPKAGGAPAQQLVGVLSKFVNIAKGYRPRLLVVEGGVLRYYKVNTKGKITAMQELHRLPTLGGERRLLGKDVGRLSLKERSPPRGGKVWTPSSATPAQPANGSVQAQGEVHLSIATVRESRSDPKKFYVHSGTSTLQLRAETPEDRTSWVRSIEAQKSLLSGDALAGAPAKDSLPESVRSVIDAVRERLQAAGTPASETEFAVEQFANLSTVFQRRLEEERDKRRVVVDYVRTLETEKVQLENTVVAEACDFSSADISLAGVAADRRDSEGEESAPGNPTQLHGKHDGDSSDDDDEGDDEDVFYECVLDDSGDPIGEMRRRNSKSTLRQLTDGDAPGRATMPAPFGLDDMPPPMRRTEIPPPIEKEQKASLWNLLKEAVGKDLTRICLPVTFNEPLSALEKACEDMEYSELLDRAAMSPKGSADRMALTAAFAVSGYASTEGRTLKPFNPLELETYELLAPEKGFRFISEKVCHHPTIVAASAEGRGWRFDGSSNIKSKFAGRCIELIPIGGLSVTFHDGETISWHKVITTINNIIIGKIYVDNKGTMKLESNASSTKAFVKFKEAGLFERSLRQLKGELTGPSGEMAGIFEGNWDRHLTLIRPTHPEPETLWERQRPGVGRRYQFGPFTASLNELLPGMEAVIAPTDSRLRPDQRLCEEGRFTQANAEKQRLEHKQRAARKRAEEGGGALPKWFEKVGDSDYRYKGGYWECREARSGWDGCRDIFGA